jgi:chloramphenicol O-acetyltransferase type B|tara:strand:- start:216 stop:344 length:129 start_codon:yes stop_codon:yes gene_type:complete
MAFIGLMAWWDWPLDDIQAAMPLTCSGNIRDLYHYWQEPVRS